MKNILPLLGAAVLFAGCANTNAEDKTQAAPAAVEQNVVKSDLKLAYINLEEIAGKYDYANDERAAVEAKVTAIQNEVNKRGKKLETDMKDWQDKVQKGLMTRSTAEIEGEKLEKRRVEFQQYASQKEQEVVEEQTVLMNKIGEAIKTYMEKYNADKGYDMIFVNQAGNPIIAASSALDITAEVLEGLNAEYLASKSK